MAPRNFGNLADLWAVGGKQDSATQIKWHASCPNCGWHIKGKFSRCPSCSADLRLRQCPFCGGEVFASLRQCPRCTAPLN